MKAVVTLSPMLVKDITCQKVNAPSCFGQEKRIEILWKSLLLRLHLDTSLLSGLFHYSFILI